MRTKDIIALSMVKGLGPATIKKNVSKLREYKSSFELVKELKPEELEMFPNYL